MLADDCPVGHSQVAMGQRVEAQVQEVEGNFDAEVAVTDRLAKAAVVAAVVEADCGVEARRQKVGGQPSKSAEPCVGCICYQALVMGSAEEQGRKCIVECLVGNAAEWACNFGSRVAVESSLSEGDACCSDTEA